MSEMSILQMLLIISNKTAKSKQSEQVPTKREFQKSLTSKWRKPHNSESKGRSLSQTSPVDSTAQNLQN